MWEVAFGGGDGNLIQSGAKYPPASTPGRRRNMQAIRRTDTKPEVALRSALHRLGYRFRKDYRIRVETGWVRPDIVFPRARLAVFVDGCFWHGCPTHGRRPQVNEWYWLPKLQRTQERDATNTAALQAAGWQVVRLWEHEPLPARVREVERRLNSRGLTSGKGSAARTGDRFG